MAKVCILIPLFLQLFCTLVQGQESPCPQYFTYITKPGTNEKIGRIEIQSPPKIGEQHLKVILKLAAELPSNFVGRLELARSKEESAENVRQGRNLLYHLHFPLRQPIPTLSELWFNGQKYCSGPEAIGNIITTITLEHTLYIPNMLSQNSQPDQSHENPRTTPKSQQSTPKRDNTVTLSQEFGKNNIFLNMLPNQPVPSNYNNIFLNMLPNQPVSYNNSNNIFLRTQTRIAPPYNNIFLRPNQSLPKPVQQYNNNNNNNNNLFPWPIPTKSAPQHPNNNNNDNNDECGISTYPGSTNLLIANGQTTLPGQWPWLVALFVVRNEYKFQCAGTILTKKHILTAAHCLKLNPTSNETIPRNVLEVALGRFNLYQFRERGTVNRGVANYTIHPEYAHEISSDSDLAILILRTPVEYNHFIKPICLWSGPIELYSIINRTGYVVGWGKDELDNPYTEEPRLANMPIVSQENCHWSNEYFVKLTSNRTFCAGMQDGSGPCNGDSGSGLVLFDVKTNRFQLRGVVSRSLHGNGPLCDLSKFVVFVDVAKYLPWIHQQISIT